MKLAEGVKAPCSGMYIAVVQGVGCAGLIEYSDADHAWYHLGSSAKSKTLAEELELIAGPFTAEQVAAWWKQHHNETPTDWRSTKL
jgi:hypothetical protein